MIKNFLKRFVGVMTFHTIVEAGLAVISFSYLASMAAQWWKGVEVTFDSLPPIFWPILSVSVLVVIVARFIALRRERRNLDRQLFCGEVNRISRELRNAVRPEMLNPEWQQNSNLPYMRDEAARSANFISGRLRENAKTKHLIPATRCDADYNDSLHDWSECLARCAEALNDC